MSSLRIIPNGSTATMQNIPVFILNFDFLFFSFQCGLTSFVKLHSYFMTVSEVFLELIALLRPFQRCFGS